MENLIEELKLKIIDRLNLLEIDPKDIGQDDPLFNDGLGLDSIDALELVVIFEKDYGITVTEIESMSEHFRSLKTLAAFVKENRTN
ncbi:phosphopantetheine-binding protein [Flavobacteriaceae bacterium]|jgi:acyl carrier protein|nr:phosphopantetheine-binding protein [Flavobacteriaceae bacterium]